ncbi:unnamed protein product [Polarella glacialis]|uniref:Reverse transcriptase domain-containing protein n=1 Tax=Polarella glacialis TaxID=89957 RepID=A0A813JBS9_POLGL|nr:unnamed protein product [Polarella glacialis]
MHFLFLDWSKAFDSITHENIEIALQRYEVPEPFTKAITALYRAPTFRVKNGSDLSSLHPQQRGIRQGCLLLNLEKCEHLQLNTEQDIYFRDTEQGQCQCSTCFPGSPVPHGPPVPVSAIVKYLGVYLSQKARAQTDITKRLAITYASLKVLRPFSSQETSLQTGNSLYMDKSSEQ